MDASSKTDTIASFEVTCSDGFADWLGDTGVSLAFTGGGRLFLAGVNADAKDPEAVEPGNQLALFDRRFDGARGLYAAGDTLLMGSQWQVWRFQNALAKGQTAKSYDRLYVPQVAWTTGEIATNDIALAGSGQIVMGSSLFNCLAVNSEEFSFAPVWRPRFISELVPEERCRLSGFAIVDGAPRFVTVGAVTDEPQGWVREMANGGCVIDTRTNEVIAHGMCLPAAPRLHNGRLWLHEAGSGWFGYVEPERGRFNRVAFCPGFLRGLAFAGGLAFCAVSRQRDGHALEGLPVQASLDRLKAAPQCAILAINPSTGDIVHWLRMEGDVAEIFDVAVIHKARRPAAVGLSGRDIRRVLAIAPERGRLVPPDGRTIGNEVGPV